MTIQVSPHRLYQERTSSLVMANEIKGINDQLTYSAHNAQWTGNSNQIHHTLSKKLQGFLNDINDALEVSSSQLAEAAEVYQRIDTNVIK